MKFRILFRRLNPARSRHHQKEKPRNLQPQLMRRFPESASGGGHGPSRSPRDAAALHLLPRHARHYP
jgi:hypothetical protein